MCKHSEKVFVVYFYDDPKKLLENWESSKVKKAICLFLRVLFFEFCEQFFSPLTFFARKNLIIIEKEFVFFHACSDSDNIIFAVYSIHITFNFLYDPNRETSSHERRNWTHLWINRQGRKQCHCVYIWFFACLLLRFLTSDKKIPQKVFLHNFWATPNRKNVRCIFFI